jgi:endoglucanase Acf2
MCMSFTAMFMAYRYMGHSWASGLQASLDGKNQESSSEAANAYLAIVQLGKATGDAVLEGWGQLLLANEVTAARKDVQVYKGNDIYLQVGPAKLLEAACRLLGAAGG